MTRLSEQLEGTLTRREQRRVRRHLTACADCFSVYVSLARVVAGLRALGGDDPLAPRASIADGVVARLRNEGAPTRPVDQASRTSGPSEKGVV